MKKKFRENRRARGDRFFFFETMACANLFCFLKSKKMRIQRRDLHNREHKQRFFDQKKGDIVFPFFQRKESVSLCWKVDNRKEKMLQKKNVVEKRRFWWGLRPCGSSHKTFLTEHAVRFFTELSEGLRLLFSWFEWWEKGSASRQGHRPPYRFSAFCRRVTVLRHAAHTSSKHSNVWKLCVDAH